MPAYAELQITSNFGFLRGASHPEELVVQAQALGLAGLALTDRNSLAGIVRAHQQAKESGLRFLVGCRLDLVDGTSLLCWPTDRPAYARLSSLLTHGKRLAAKGGCTLTLEDVLAHDEGQLFALLPPETPDAAFAGLARRLARGTGGAGSISPCPIAMPATMPRASPSSPSLARDTGDRPLATNDVHYHHPDRRPLQDVLTCIREHVRITETRRRSCSPMPSATSSRRRRWRACSGTIRRRWRARWRSSSAAASRSTSWPTTTRSRTAYDGRTPDQELARRTWAGARRALPGPPAGEGRAS